METNNLERRLHPHHATITLKLDVRKIDKDGGLDTMVMGNSLLKKYGISTRLRYVSQDRPRQTA
jgi:hypothetical protein